MRHFGLNLVLGKMHGEIIRGDQRIFIEQIREGVHLTSGKFMQGEFPVMMFGLPRLAIYQTLNLRIKR